MKVTQRNTIFAVCVLFLPVVLSQGEADTIKWLGLPIPPNEDADDATVNLRGLKQNNNDKNKNMAGAECPCGICQDFSGLGLIEKEPCVAWSSIPESLRNNAWGDKTCQTNTCANGCCRAYTWLKCDDTGQRFPHVKCICNENTQDPSNFNPVTLPPVYIPPAGQGDFGCPEKQDDSKNNNKDKSNDKNKNKAGGMR